VTPKPKPQTILSNSSHILHGGDYNPDQWLDHPDILERDLGLMKASGCNTFSIGIFSWTSYESEEGMYHFDWLDTIMDRMAAEGHKVILATPSGSKPAWLSAKHPEIRKVGANGIRAPHLSRHNHCWSSPVYRKKVQAINEQLAKRYKDHPALAMWHISNEYGTPCFCDLCLKSFHQWLEKKYGNLEELNRRWYASFWNHTFTAWEQIDPRDDSMDALRCDWNRFHTDQVISFYLAEHAPLQTHSPDIPKTTNLMGLFNPINYWELSKHLDVIGNDSYPVLDRNDPELWKRVSVISMTHSFLRVAAKRTGRPWFLMESSPSIIQWAPAKLKAPGQHQAESLQAIANGAEGVLYFQWRKGAGGYEKFHGAVIDHEGSENTRVFKEVAALGKQLSQMGELMGSEVQAKAAVIYDWESRWQLQNSSGTLSHRCIEGGDSGYNPQAHYRELWRRSIATDVISPEHDFSQYALIVAPQLFMLKPGIAKKIKAYVESGGVFVGTYYIGYVNEDGRCFEGGFPGDGLREVFGVWNEEYDLVPKGESKSLRFSSGQNATGKKICELLHAEGASTLAHYTSDFYADTPALTQNTFGKGQAFYMGTELSEEGLRILYDKVVTRSGLATGHGLADKPDHVDICERKQAESGRQTLFITNWSQEPTRLHLGDLEILPFNSPNSVRGYVTLQAFECLCGTLLSPVTK